MRELLILAALLITIGSTAQVPFKSETVTINGKPMYYEVYGSGEPLFLFHGGFISPRAWRSYVDAYDDHFQVYLVDLPGHGRSYPFKDTPSIESAAVDVHALLQYLEVDSIKGIGYSYGGFMLYELAKLDPSMVEAFIPIGACGEIILKDLPPDFLKYFMKEATKIAKAYQLSQAHLDGVAKFEQSDPVKTSNEDFQKIKSRVLIVFGDDDFALHWSELARARKHIPNSDLWIIPNMGHGAHEGANKEEFIKVSTTFLKG